MYRYSQQNLELGSDDQTFTNAQQYFEGNNTLTDILVLWRGHQFLDARTCKQRCISSNANNKHQMILKIRW